MLVVGVLAALPTVLALLASPELILDDIQFATTARFDGLGGFVEEMTYRPGQGLIHGLQFTAFGTNAVLHMLLLAVANALNAVLGFRLLRHWWSPAIAGAIIAVWLALPDRGSTRYWVSTVPNHVALALVLIAALLITRRWTAITRSTWLIVASLLVTAVVTYEAIGVFAGLVVIAGAIAQRGWHRPGLRELVGPSATALALAAAALFVLTQSPRGGASTMLAAPGEGIIHYLDSLTARPFGMLGAVLVPMAVLWAVVDRRPSVRQQRVLVAAGIGVAAAGLAPFLVAGFNVQNVGVLDRSLFFAGIGTALMLGAVASVIVVEVASVDPQIRRLTFVFGALFAVGSAFAVIDDLGPYVSSWDDQRRAAAALDDIEPELLGLIDNDDVVVLTDVPIDDGVAWAHYGLQVQDLYQLVNDQADEPGWLGLAWGEPADGAVAVSVVGSELRPRASSASQD